ncbi:hypothetical protein JCM9279_000942 [Rhodotorula babjevae]
MDPTPPPRTNSDRPALERSRSFSELQVSLRTWRRLPTITAFKRVDDETVKVQALEHTLYSDPEKRRAWQGAFFIINKRVRSLGETVELADGSRFKVGPAQFAKIDNWMSTIPLPLVLLEYDRLWAENVHGASMHSTVAFAIAMFEWYSRTRSAAHEAGEHWAQKLSTLELRGESSGWHEYVHQLSLELAGDHGRPAQLYPHRAEFFKSDQVAVEPTLTDLYVGLHENEADLLDEAKKENPTASRSPHRVVARKVWGYVPNVFKRMP